jgi:hypothetical protein
MRTKNDKIDFYYHVGSKDGQASQAQDHQE